MEDIKAIAVDCISRADAIRVASGYCHPSNVAKELAKLPSVTPQEPRWIPVSERLPEDNKTYLVTIELTFDRSKRYVSQEIRNNWDNLKSCGHEVIAWMPLPKPYEPQESEDT